MALTTFAALTQPEKYVWARQTMAQARNLSFIEKFVGKDANSYIQRVTEFSKDEKGATARIGLVSDLTGAGAMGDTELWGSEEALSSSWLTIGIDQIRNGNRLAGRMTDQKAVINFRTETKDKLAYWMADMNDQMAFHHLSGIDSRLKLNGAIRTGFTYDNAGNSWSRTAGTGLALFDHGCMGAANASPANDAAYTAMGNGIYVPSTNRGLRWVKSTKTFAASAFASMVAEDRISYECIVNLKAYAKERYIRGVRTAGGEEEYLLIVGPRSMARLRLDSDFLANSRALQTGAGDKGQLATGAGGVLVNGVRVIESRYVFNTQGAADITAANQDGDPGRKWGTYGNGTTTKVVVDGERCLFLGAQALAYADIGLPSWDEQPWDYDNQQGIAISKIVGFRKPIYRTNYELNASYTDGYAREDFGVITLDVAV